MKAFSPRSAPSWYLCHQLQHTGRLSAWAYNLGFAAKFGYSKTIVCLYCCEVLYLFKYTCAPLYSCTHVHGYSCTVIQNLKLYCCTVVRLYTNTPEQSYSCTLELFYSCTGLQLYHVELPDVKVALKGILMVPWCITMETWKWVETAKKQVSLITLTSVFGGRYGG